MGFQFPEYLEPGFDREPLVSPPNAKTEPVLQDGVAPNYFHTTTIFPEYFKTDNKWILAKESRMDCPVVVDENQLQVTEQRRLRRGEHVVGGEHVVVGRGENGEEGIYVHTRKVTTLIGLATQLHPIAVGNMTPSYPVMDGRVRLVYFYAVDI